MTPLSRRSLLAGAALGALAVSTIDPTLGRAAVPPSGQAAPAFYRSKVGRFEVTAVYDGLWNRPVDEKFVRNAPFARVQQALKDAFMPAEKLSIPFTPLVINTGAKLVMIDAGSGGQIAPTAGSLVANLAAAGIEPKAIDIILISNFHPDHINGIKTKDNEVVFPNAEIKVPAKEWAFWMDNANAREAESKMVSSYMLNARRIFADIRSRVTPFAGTQEVAPGIVPVDAPGHTPGHTAYAISSGNESLMALCDVTNHPWLFARNPDWQPLVDQDGPLAVKTRRRILDRVSADRMRVQGYHFPFPAFGYIAKAKGGYDFVPEPWQTAL